MRVLHVVTLMSPDGRYGGPVDVAERLARATRRRGHQVAIAAGATGFHGDEPRRRDGVAYRLFRVWGGGGTTRFSRLVAPGLWMWLWRASRSADIVHLHLSRDLIMVLAAMIACARRRRCGGVVVQTHGMIIPSSSRLARAVDALAIRPTLRMADVVLCLNPDEAAQVKEVEPAARTRLLPNGVETVPRDRRSGAERRDARRAPARREVLFLARLNARKRPLDFVRMARELEQRHPDVVFTLVGPDGGDADRVRSAIAAARSSAISWEGAVPPHAVRARIAAASVYVLPAVDEPFGLTTVEAMACGVPVVISAGSGLAEAVESASAGIVYDDTTGGLVDAVERLLRDDGLAQAMGERGRELVERDYSIDGVADRLLELYPDPERGESRFRALWVTNVAAPYRVPVWRELSQLCDLEVALLEDDARLSADVAANRGADWRSDRVRDVRIRSLPTLRLARGEARFYALTRVPRIRQDAVLLGGWESPAYWQLLLVARLTGRRVVGFYESIQRTQRHRRGPIAAARRWYFRSLDAVVVPGVEARDALTAMGVDAGRISVGFNAVDVADIHRRATAARGPESAPGHRYLYVGQLVDRKGVDLAIAAFARARGPEDTLTIVGHGPLQGDLRALAVRLGIGADVDFRGPVENADLPEILARHDTLVMPSREDVWGLVANEGLAAGLHVVVSSVAGVAASVSGMRGVFVVAPERDAFADGMRASARSWEGPIAEPEILAHDPGAFARVFAAALRPPCARARARVAREPQAS